MADAPTDEIVVTGKKKQGGNDVSISCNGKTISGWTSIRITRGVELCPSSFDLSFTEKFPQTSDIVIEAGTPCTVSIGDTLVLTGYVDRFSISISGDSHTLAIQGRGRCQDLVDCSAQWPGNQISGSSVVGIAQKLAQPYGIDVSLASGAEPSDPIPQFNFSIGETPWEIIEKISRYRGLLVFEDEHGNLVFDTVGSTSAAASLAEGVNVETASVVYSMDQRYSDYGVYLLSQAPIAEAAGDSQSGNFIGEAQDQFVPRFRNKDIICESGVNGQQITIQRANWEMGRRFGRSYAVTVTTDTWRDSETTLWSPNTRVTLNLPTLKITGQSPPPNLKWVISETTYRRDEGGTHCDLAIMPEQAFQPEPVLLQPNFQAEINQAPEQ